MKSTPTLRRWLSFAASVVVFGLIAAVVACQRGKEPDVIADDKKDDRSRTTRNRTRRKRTPRRARTSP